MSFKDGADGRERAEDPETPERWLRKALEQAPLGVYVFAPDGTSLLTNAAWDELGRLLVNEHTPARNVFDDESVRAAGLLPYMRRALGGEAMETPPLLFDLAETQRGDRARWLRALLHPVTNEEGRIACVTMLLEEVTVRKELEEELARRALHDALTGLPNRVLFLDRLKHAMDRAKRGDDRVAVLFVDLDDFKPVNDSLGHGAGDQLLVEAAERIGGCVRPGDTVARLGGDEFAVLLEETEALLATGLARRIARELSAPTLLAGHEIFPTASIGIAFGHPREDDPRDVLGNADRAMYEAKRAGKTKAKFYDPSMSQRSRQKLKLVTDLRGAVERGEIVVYYQPMVSISRGAVVGMEALARWEHPERGLLLPEDFIPLAEETGLIVPIGGWVLREACRRTRGWRPSVGDGPFTVSVNLSTRQLSNPGVVGEVEEALREAELPAGALILEITESFAVENAGPMEETLRRLRALGVGLAIDDFGTGYSSLSYLGRLPVQRVKLDRALVGGLEREPSSFTIALSTITLAHGLGLEVVAEGVQTSREVAKLHALRCDLGQGYHWWLPLGPREAADVLG